MKTLLCSGQSNAQDQNVGGDFNISSRVSVWNCTPERDDLSSLGSAFITPDRALPPFRNGGVNMFVKASSYIAEALAEDVRLILVTYSGRSIDAWVGPNCTAAPMLKRIEAVLSATGVAKVDGFGWMQGETYAPEYAAKFENLIILLKRSGALRNGDPIVLGELAPQFSAANADLGLLECRHKDIAIARIQHFPLFDAIHYSGPSKNRAGLTFAKKFMEAWA